MKNGFIVTIGIKDYILISDKKNVTDDIARKFITKILELKGKSQEYINIALQHRPTLDDIKQRCDRCSLEAKESFYSIKGKNFSISIPFTEADTIVIFD